MEDGSVGTSGGVVIATIAGLATVYAALLTVGTECLPLPKIARTSSRPELESALRVQYAASPAQLAYLCR